MRGIKHTAYGIQHIDEKVKPSQYLAQLTKYYDQRPTMRRWKSIQFYEEDGDGDGNIAAAS